MEMRARVDCAGTVGTEPIALEWWHEPFRLPGLGWSASFRNVHLQNRNDGRSRSAQFAKETRLLKKRGCKHGGVTRFVRKKKKMFG